MQKRQFCAALSGQTLHQFVQLLVHDSAQAKANQDGWQVFKRMVPK
jgi:hypothetical protein